MEVKTIKLVDNLIGTPSCLFLGILNRLWFIKRLKSPKKILIIQLWGIGETILTLNAIKELRDLYKEAEIDILITKRVKEVFTGFDFYDNLIVIETDMKGIRSFVMSNFRKYDLVVDFEEYLNISSLMSFFVGKYRIGYNNRIRGLTLSKSAKYNDQQHVVETHLDLIRLLKKVDPCKSLIKLRYSDQDKNVVDEYLKNKGPVKGNLLIALCPGAAESARSRLWPLENYAQLADMLIKDNKAKIVFIGTKEERQAIDRITGLMKEKDFINSAGDINLKQLFYLEEICDLIISNDSGPMHIGAAMQTRTIGLFGPNIPVRWGPFNERSSWIYKGHVCKYSPCINVHLGKVPECLQPGNNNICMKNIMVEDVFSEAVKSLHK